LFCLSWFCPSRFCLYCLRQVGPRASSALSVSSPRPTHTTAQDSREPPPNSYCRYLPFLLPSLPSSPPSRVCRRPIRGRCRPQWPWRWRPKPHLTQVHALFVSLLSLLPDHPLSVTTSSPSFFPLPLPRSRPSLGTTRPCTSPPLLTRSVSPPTAPTLRPTTPHALAYDALHALDAVLPGLLAEVLGTSTRSSSRQSYLLLLASAARHIVRLGRLASSASILAVAVGDRYLSGPLEG
jgi:hypothetical protein